MKRLVKSREILGFSLVNRLPRIYLFFTNRFIYVEIFPILKKNRKNSWVELRCKNSCSFGPQVFRAIPALLDELWSFLLKKIFFSEICDLVPSLARLHVCHRIAKRYDSTFMRSRRSGRRRICSELDCGHSDFQKLFNINFRTNSWKHEVAICFRNDEHLDDWSTKKTVDELLCAALYGRRRWLRWRMLLTPV